MQRQHQYGIAVCLALSLILPNVTVFQAYRERVARHNLDISAASFTDNALSARPMANRPYDRQTPHISFGSLIKRYTTSLLPNRPSIRVATSILGILLSLTTPLKAAPSLFSPPPDSIRTIPQTSQASLDTQYFLAKQSADIRTTIELLRTIVAASPNSPAGLAARNDLWKFEYLVGDEKALETYKAHLKAKGIVPAQYGEEEIQTFSFLYGQLNRYSEELSLYDTLLKNPTLSESARLQLLHLRKRPARASGNFQEYLSTLEQLGHVDEHTQKLRSALEDRHLDFPNDHFGYVGDMKTLAHRQRVPLTIYVDASWIKRMRADGTLSNTAFDDFTRELNRLFSKLSGNTFSFELQKVHTGLPAPLVGDAGRVTTLGIKPLPAIRAELDKGFIIMFTPSNAGNQYLGNGLITISPDSIATIRAPESDAKLEGSDIIHKLSLVAAHEVGHAFGTKDHHLLPFSSYMNELTQKGYHFWDAEQSRVSLDSQFMLAKTSPRMSFSSINTVALGWTTPARERLSTEESLSAVSEKVDPVYLVKKITFQTAARQERFQTQQRPMMSADEQWVREELVAASQRLFTKVFANELSAERLSEWIDTTIRKVNPDFHYPIDPNSRDNISIDQMFQFWDQVVSQVLVPSGYIAYPPHSGKPPRIGKIVSRIESSTVAGRIAPVLIVEPLEGTDSSAYTAMNYIVIPKHFYAFHKSIENLRNALSSGWAESHPTPPELGAPGSYERLKSLSDWIVMQALARGKMQNLSYAEAALRDMTLQEELAHWDLLHHLSDIYDGKSPYGFSPDEWFGALADHVFRPEWKAQHEVEFKRMTMAEKQSFINAWIELQSQLTTLAITSEPLIAFMRFNLAPGEHGAGARELRMLLAPALLDKTSADLDKWAPDISRQLTRGIPRIQSPVSAMDLLKIPRNMMTLNEKLRTESAAIIAALEQPLPARPRTTESPIKRLADPVLNLTIQPLKALYEITPHHSPKQPSGAQSLKQAA